MATITQPSGIQRGEMLRGAWSKIKDPGSNILGHVIGFFSAYPPLAQGLYYLFLGLWPLLSLASYQKVTGDQGDLWLLEVSGVLLLVIGSTLCLAAYRKQGSPEVLFLAFGSAGALTAIDLHLIYRGASIFYFIDAVLQVGLVIFWAYGWRKGTRTPSQTPPAYSIPTATRVGN